MNTEEAARNLTANLSRMQNPPQGGSAVTHQHLYRVAIGDLGIVRYCERCGETHIMQAVVDLFDMERTPKKYVWIKVEEQEQS